MSAEEQKCSACGAVDVETISVALGVVTVDYCRECWDNMDESAPDADDFDRNACPGCGGNCQVACS